jgi:hypothetical protein
LEALNIKIMENIPETIPAGGYVPENLNIVCTRKWKRTICTKFANVLSIEIRRKI